MKGCKASNCSVVLYLKSFLFLWSRETGKRNVCVRGQVSLPSPREAPAHTVLAFSTWVPQLPGEQGKWEQGRERPDAPGLLETRRPVCIQAQYCTPAGVPRGTQRRESAFIRTVWLDCTSHCSWYNCHFMDAAWWSSTYCIQLGLSQNILIYVIYNLNINMLRWSGLTFSDTTGK